MNKLILLSLISLSVVLACHSSCNCDFGSNVCKSCKYASIGAQVDSNKRSCPCPAGYYQKTEISTSPQNNCNYEYRDYTYIGGCYLGCLDFATVEEAQAACTNDPGCGGVTLSQQSGFYGATGKVDGNWGYQLRISKYFSYHHNEKSWLKTCTQSTTTTVITSTCIRLMNTDESGNNVAVEMQACKLDIGLKTKDMKVLTDCHFENNDGKSYVVSKVNLDLTNCNFNSVCLDSIVTKIQRKQNSDNSYVDLLAEYVTDNSAGNKTIKIPLIDIFGLANLQSINDQQITQVMHLKILIGHSDNFVRSHKWDLTVYTNRDQVEVFTIDVDIQETEGCQPGQECIVIADLDTVSNVYTNSNFDTIQSPSHDYLVGDIFYAKIKFADPTYTKRLTFENLYFKTDQNKIFNFKSITNAAWDGTGLRISLPLVYPSVGAVIQVNMKISSQNARFLVGESSDDQTVQSKFTTTIIDYQSISQTANQNQNESNAIVLLGINISLLLFLLF